jgi:dCTP deaminase
MILSKNDIRQAVERGEIGFSPGLEDTQWGEASIDLRLGFQFTKFKDASGLTVSVADGLKTIGKLGLWATKTLQENDEFGRRQTFDLGPGELVLALTHESIRIPPNLIGLVEGRSTYARMGLSMHQTAPWIQPGWSGPIVLEIANHGTFTIRLTPLIDRPCQLTFFELKSPLDAAEAYGSRPGDRYQGSSPSLGSRRKEIAAPVAASMRFRGSSEKSEFEPDWSYRDL